MCSSVVQKSVVNNKNCKAFRINSSLDIQDFPFSYNKPIFVSETIIYRFSFESETKFHRPREFSG